MSPPTTIEPAVARSVKATRGEAVAPRFLLRGYDTLQCCFYLRPRGAGGIDFERLLATREGLHEAGAQDPTPVALWHAVRQAIEDQDALEGCNPPDPKAVLEHWLALAGVAFYGYLKRVAALRCVLDGRPSMQVDEALKVGQGLIRRVHDRLSRSVEVKERIDQIRLGR